MLWVSRASSLVYIKFSTRAWSDIELFIIGFTPVAGMLSNTGNRAVAVYNCKANIGRKAAEEVLKIGK
ncbi:hypothetical protein GCM10011425_39840 [Mucilaginibacter galii]|uniref:Uncharacterized protein n=1 Tax=Mucilaginibacter galii TaxID=2005073 RepID=A0A917JDY3_9SPHI|nr:hypothetical protein GCM10011425_39840 [Mucilaginibacter galii]